MLGGFLASLFTCWLDQTPMSRKDEPFIFGATTRELYELFLHHVGENQHHVMTGDKVRPALQQLGLFPSKSQVHELVHCACESSGRTPVDHITFGEFCILVTELQEHYRSSSPIPPQPRSQVKDRAALEERRKKRRLSGRDGHFKVFLGGSCNPTTWRHDTAIPYLKSHNITFFNPQVSNWKPDLMELEDQAKQSAELLFFVIDNQTRSTASMVEAAYLAGCGRQLILVVKDFSGPGAVINGEAISTIEYEDLERSHSYLTDLVERMGIPVFNDIHIALACTHKSIRQNLRVGDLTLSDGAQPVRFPHVRVADKFIKLKDAFNALDTNNSGRLTLSEVSLAYQTVTDDALPSQVVQDHKERNFTFEEFCCLVSEFKYKRKSWWQKLFGGLIKLPTRFVDWLNGSSGGKSAEEEMRQRDVYLGGTCGTTTWREDIAIPILRKHGMSYFNPQLPGWAKHYIPLEAAVKERCRLLLYVVTADTRGITSMLEAAHYIGQGCNVILCIQHLKNGVVIDGEKLTPTGVKDYNRARSYLIDLANRDGVPIFDQVSEAVECAVKRLRHDDF